MAAKAVHDYLHFKRRKRRGTGSSKKRAKKRRRLLVKKMLKVVELNPENVWLKCRLIQRQTGCSHKAIKSMINSVCGKIPRATMVKMDKKLIDVGGGLCLQLNGCDNCNRHVFLPSSKETCCPKCGGARFDDKGKPKEVCQYFPLRKQIEKLLGLPAFRDLLKYEHQRATNSAFMTDVHDSPMWAKRFGVCEGTLRIVLQLCVDGIPAFAIKHSLSIKPVVFMNLSLPPKLRAQAAYMFLLMLIPAKLKGQAARKYYDFAAEYEMNNMHDHGINGVKVMMFGNTLDTPGRAEMLNMQVRHIQRCFSIPLLQKKFV